MIDLVSVWSKGKLYKELDITQFLNNVYLLTNPKKESRSKETNLESINILPISSENVSNGVTSRSNNKFVDKLIEAYGSEVILNNDNQWIKL